MWIRTRWCILFLATFASASGLAHAKKNKKEAFKTTHVTIYDNGLAQIEKQTKVKGAWELSIDVEIAHLDDLLASLVLATDGGVKVEGVNYPTVQNLPQAVAASGLGNALSADGAGMSTPEDLPGYFRALAGTDVTVTRTDGHKTRGTVLACVKQASDEVDDADDSDNKKKITPEWTVVLVTQSGALSWLPLKTVSGITPVSNREAAAIGDMADRMGNAGGFNKTSIAVKTAPRSDGKLAASYIRQAPLWKMIYKITSSSKSVLVEMWALVHNDTGEDWRDINMTLLSGLPKSYVVSMASPRYAEREALYLKNEGQMIPQLGAHTSDSLLYEWDQSGYGMIGSAVGSNFGFGGLGLRGTGRGGGGSGSRESSLLTVGESAAEDQTEASVEEEISVYKALNKVSIPAGTSSMVPLLHKTLPGQAFTLIEQGSEPSTCVRIKNETGLVLQGGMASFFRDGRFRGQNELSRTEPSEIGVWCFGEDMDVEFTRHESALKTEEMVEWKGGSLWVHSRRKTTYTYDLKNRAGQPRQLAIDVRHMANGRVIEPQNLVEADVDNRKLLIFNLSARAEKKQKIVVEEGVASSTSVSIEELVRLSKVSTLPVARRAIMSASVALIHKENQLLKAVAVAEKKIGEEAADIDDNRETLQVVRGNTRRRARIVEDLVELILEARERVKKLRKEIARLNEATAANKDKQAENLKKLAPRG